jgi:hypothetical protein
VVAAYDQLLAQGLVEARRNRGFYVRDWTRKPRSAPDQKAPEASFSIASSDPCEARRLNAPISASTLMRGMFHSGSDRPQPGMGVLPPEWLDNPFMATALERVSAGRGLLDASIRYGDPQGDATLRRVLAERLTEQGIDATPAQVVTTIGATQALDIVSRTLLKPGDTVMVEEPGWSVEFARLSALGMRLLPVPRLASGPDLAVMARYCEDRAGTPEAPRLFVSVSVLHNPTGFCLSPASAHQLLQLAQHFHGDGALAGIAGDGEAPAQSVADAGNDRQAQSMALAVLALDMALHEFGETFVRYADAGVGDLEAVFVQANLDCSLVGVGAGVPEQVADQHVDQGALDGEDGVGRAADAQFDRASEGRQSATASSITSAMLHAGSLSRLSSRPSNSMALSICPMRAACR